MTAVISLGNPYDGLSLIGPFESEYDATDYAHEYLDGEEWHVVNLLAPARVEPDGQRMGDGGRILPTSR